MGYAYDVLIPPAILFDHPKITKEEFANRLDNTHSQFFFEYKPEQDWSDYNPEMDIWRFHRGLEGLSDTLGIGGEWTKQRGHFEGDLHAEKFLWMQTEGRYCLDPKTFDQIPASFGCTNNAVGYVDLVLTAEAIKHQAWKLLSRKGLNHLEQFLRDFPDSASRYKMAVWDSHTSLSAKIQKLSISDFLRFRFLGN